jgi:hypothetical protein
MIIQPQIANLAHDIKYLIVSSQEKAIRAIDFERVILYWGIGKRIFEEIQAGVARAESTKNLWSKRELERQINLLSEEELVKELYKELKEIEK